MGLHFQSSKQSNQYGVANCLILGVRKFWLVGFKNGKIRVKINCYRKNCGAVNLKPWPNYRTKLDSTLQLCSIQHCSTVWPPMLDHVRPTFFVRSGVGWSLLLIKHCDQQFCLTQQCCSVLPLFQQSCVLNRVTFALLRIF